MRANHRLRRQSRPVSRKGGGPSCFLGLPFSGTRKKTQGMSDTRTIEELHRDYRKASAEEEQEARRRAWRFAEAEEDDDEEEGAM